MLFLCFLIFGTDDETQLRHIKTKLWPQAYRTQDSRLLDRILADEFQMIDASGEISTKAAELDYISKNKPDYKSFHFEIERLDIFENGTAVVAGQGTIIRVSENGEQKITYRSSNILIKRNGVWKAISSHVSGVKTF